ncbi:MULTISPECIES: Pycsar system effector family protein [unclassified Streptomyces]|uniref:Pycsar system effector family protein n=1 Tax=unclassified Streptomyces TaxID=2593676 RepID=UPI0035D5BF75
MAADPLETAWKIQAALADSTGKADTKASIALSLQSTVLALLGVLATSGHGMGSRSVTSQALLWAGGCILLCGALLAAAAVTPNLRLERKGPGPDDDYLFFGHLRHFEPEALEAALRSGSALSALSRQIIVMSEIAWTKHRRVQLSLLLAVMGCATLGASAAIG